MPYQEAGWAINSLLWRLYMVDIPGLLDSASNRQFVDFAFELYYFLPHLHLICKGGLCVHPDKIFLEGMYYVQTLPLSYR